MTQGQFTPSSLRKSAATVSATLNRWRYAVPLLLLLAILPFYYLAWSAPGVGLSHDDGIYLATAKALATGKGYTIISLPNEIKQTKYPILFPLLLSFLWRIAPNFPQNIWLLKLIPLVATAAWMMAVYRLARELLVSRVWALCIMACVLANPWVVSFSGLLRPENLFAALATWTVVFLLRAERTGQLPPALWAALLASAAYLTRTAAVPIIAGGFLGLLLARRFRLAVYFGVASAVVCSPWIIWQAQQKVLPPVERYYTSLCYRQENILSYFSGHEKAVILLQNLVDILVAPCVLFGFPITLAGLGMSVLFWVICAIGLVRIRNRCLQCIVVFWILMPALWAWAPFRFLFCAVGLLLLAAYSACKNQAVRVAALLLLLVSLSGSLWSIWTDSRRTQLVSIEFKDYPATWQQMMNVQTWFRAEASPGDVVISSVDPLVYFYTTLKSIRGFYVDALPVYYGLPAKEDGDREFLRIMGQYHPRYLLQMRPDFYEARFLGHITVKLLQAGYIAEVHTAGPLHVYRVLQIPPLDFAAAR